MTDPIKSTVEYGRCLFARLEEFFLRATGKSAAKFATIETFSDVIRANAHDLASRGEAAFVWLDTEVRAFQARGGLNAFRAAKQLGGMRLVLGGSNRFLRSQLNSVSTAVLYSDTVLIPDPIMPWLERDRKGERFRHVLLLQAVHALLHLKPLVDTDLHCPPVVVFPSWEKSLEDRHARTQDGISQLIGDVLSNFLGEPLANLDEAGKYADRYPDRFCEAVDRDHLFVAPGAPVDEPLREVLARYEKEMATWRSREWLDGYNQLPIHRRVLYGVSERLSPLYHLLENAEELRGHPLICLEQHAHYFRLVSHASSARLEKLGVLDPRTTALAKALVPKQRGQIFC